MATLLQRVSSCSITRNCSRSLSAQPLHLDEVSHAAPLHSHRHETDIDLHAVDLPSPKIGRLVLVRHGQSEWNVTDPTRYLTARFVSYNMCSASSNYSLCMFSWNDTLNTDWMGRHRLNPTGKRSSCRRRTSVEAGSRTRGFTVQRNWIRV